MHGLADCWPSLVGPVADVMVSQCRCWAVGWATPGQASRKADPRLSGSSWCHHEAASAGDWVVLPSSNCPHKSLVFILCEALARGKLVL